MPREVKDNEYRVAMTPAGVRELVSSGHEVRIEHGAGEGSAIPDDEYLAVGAKIATDADAVWGESDLVCKVKEPIAEEFHRMHADLILFTYLHLAADRARTDAILSSRMTAIAYETVRLADGSLPLLAPMSEVAGRMAPMVAASVLERPSGGRGVLMSGVPGVRAARVVIVGAGVAGSNAASIAVGMHADVAVLDRDLYRLAALDQLYAGRLETLASSEHAIELACLEADLVIGAVLVVGACARNSSATTWCAGCARALSSSTSPSIRAAVSRQPTRRRTHTRRTASLTRSSTASRTCPARSPIPPPMRSRT